MKEIKDTGGSLLAIIDSVDNFEEGLMFYGDRMDDIQVGKFRYNKDHILRSHQHKFRPKLARKTQEIMIVFKGSCLVRTFPEHQIPGNNKLDHDVSPIDESVLKVGEFYISYYGGCGFRILEDDTRMMEVKNGPHDVNNDDEERMLLE